MTARTATIRIATTGDRNVRATLNGVTNAVRAAARDQVRIDRAAARERQAVERSTARDRARNEREALRDAQRVERERVTAARRAAREQERIAEQTARTRLRIAQREMRDRAREEDASATRGRRPRARSGGDRRGGGLAAVGGAVVAGAVSLYNRAQSTAGVGSVEQRIQAAGEFGVGVRRLGLASGYSGEQTNQLRDRIVATSDRTGIRSGELLAGLESAQSRFGPEVMGDLIEMLDDLANASVASGASIEDLVGLLGTVRSAYSEMSGDDLRTFLGASVEASRSGAIDAKDFAGAFASTLAIGAETTGRRNLGGAMEQVALAQVIGSGQFGAAESATRQEALMRELTDRETQERLRGAGVRVTNRAGELLPFDQIAEQVGNSRRLATTRGMASLGLRAESQQALLRIRAMGGEGFRSFSNADAAAGAAYINDASQQILNDPYSRLQNIGTRSENAMVRDADRVIDTYVGPLEQLQGLENEFPILTAALGTLTDVMKTVAGALVISSALSGGGAAAAGAGAAGGGGLLAAAGGGVLAALTSIGIGGAALGAILVAATAGKATDTGVRSDEAGNLLQRENERRQVLLNDLGPDARAAFLGTVRDLDPAGRQRAAEALGQQSDLGSLTAEQASQLARTGQVIELGPNTIRALQQGDGLAEGTAGEGSASRGRRNLSPRERG